MISKHNPYTKSTFNYHKSILNQLVYFALVILVSALLSACDAGTNSQGGSNTKSNLTEEAQSHNKFGNSAGNLNNGGIAAIQGDWIYFANDTDGYSIYKIHVDGSGQTKLNDDNSSYINVSGDWIYYSVSEGPRKTGGMIEPEWKSNIYKIRIDGTSRTKVNEDVSMGLTVVDDWIYYRRLFYNESGSLDADFYKIRTDGSQRTKLTDDSVYCINVAGDWIYYTDMSDNHRAYKVRTDGSDRTQLTFDGDAIFSLMMVDDWLYYSSMSRAETLIKMSTDGSHRSSFDGIGHAYGLNYSNGWFYFYNWDDHNKLYKVRLDNSEITLVCDDSVFLINIVGDWIYYANSSEDKKFYRVRTDGSERQPVY